jgi:hypothetical protein
MTFAVLSVTLLLTALPVRVEAELCPSGQEIERSLVSLFPALPSSGPADVAHVFRQGKVLRIELVDQQGVLIGGRSLDDSDHCAELAAQAAVVIASLASDVHPAFSLPAQDMPAPGPSTPAPLAPPAVRSSFDLAAGVSLSHADSFAVGGSLAGLWIPRATGFGLRLSLGAEATRVVSFGPGQRATWARRTATTEADWRYGRGPWTVDVHAGLAWTLLHADGSGFSSNASDDSFSPGALAGVRLSWWPTMATAVWFGLDATTWLVRQSVTDAPGTAEHQIPGTSVMASVGVAFGRSANRSLGLPGPGAL